MLTFNEANCLLVIIVRVNAVQKTKNVSFYSDGHHGGHGHHGESQQIERLRELVKAGNVSIGEIFALLRKGEIGVHLSHPTTTPGETLFLLRIAL